MGAQTAPARGNRAIVDLAELQHGVVAREQLHELGLSRRKVQGRLEAGWLRPVHRGVYAVGRNRLTRHGRWMAAVLACGDQALLSHRSAAELWRLVDPIDGPVHISVGRNGRGCRRGIRIHRTHSLTAEARRERERIPVTSVERTLLDLAATGSEGQLRLALESAVHRGRIDVGTLAALLDRARGRRGTGRLRALLATHRPLPETRSPLERRFLRLLREGGIPAPAVDVPLLSYEVDCLWHQHRLVVEIDGYEHHRDRTTFERDRERDVALSLGGYRVLRFTHRRIEERPASVIAAMRRALDAPRSAG